MASAGLFERLDTVIVRVNSLRDARTWYETRLGFTPSFVDEDGEKIVVFDLGGTSSLTLWQLKPGETLNPCGAAGVYPIFLSQDAAGVRQTLLERGVEVEALRKSGGVISFGFFDPDGNRLEACEVEG